MSRKDFCIYLINLYKRKRYERELFDEALNRLMTESVAKWNSYLLNDILDDIRVYQRNHYGDYERQSVLDSVETCSRDKFKRLLMIEVGEIKHTK